MRLPALLAALVVSAFASGAAAVPPTADVHDLQWYVHVDLIDVGAGRDLAFYEALIDQSAAEATELIEGGHGPTDTPCCARLDRSVAVTTFGSPGDGLDVLDSAAEYTAVTSIGSGSRVFLVDSITYCGGPAPTAIGCATLPSCDGDADDDPDLWLVTTVDAYDGRNGSQTLAHERGHNACLVHVDVEECQVMRSGAGGACLDATECTNLKAARTTTAGSCGCHDDAIGTLVADGGLCSDVASGVCSGGVCAAPTAPGGATLFAAGGGGFGTGEPTDDGLAMSGQTGGWSELGALGTSGEEVEGLAWAGDSGTLFGVVPSAGDDAIVTIDPTTGAITATVGTIANGTDRIQALAYDPGPTSAPSDDQLYALESDGTFDDLVTIDPASPSSTTLVGPLAFGAPDGFLGLAYDSIQGRLYASSPFSNGLYEVETAPCGGLCELTELAGLGLPRFASALAFSPETGLLHLVGRQSGLSPLGPRTLYDTIDPVAVDATRERVQVDAFTIGGLAAMPNTATGGPVPAIAPIGLLALGASIAAAAWRRSRRR